MEGRKMVTSLQKVGSRWLMVVEPNSNAIAQRFIVESCADSPETLSKFWREGWSVQVRKFWKDFSFSRFMSLLADPPLSITFYGRLALEKAIRG